MKYKYTSHNNNTPNDTNQKNNNKMVIGHVLSCCQIKSTIIDVNWQYGILRYFTKIHISTLFTKFQLNDKLYSKKSIFIQWQNSLILPMSHHETWQKMK